MRTNASGVRAGGVWFAAVMVVAACSEDPPDMMENPINPGGSGAPAAGMTGTAGMPPAGGSGGGGMSVPPRTGGMSGGGAGMSAGAGGMAGMAGAAGEAGMDGIAGEAGMAGMAGMAGAAGMGTGTNDCCPDGDCICRGDVPTGLTSDAGPFATESYDLRGIGCVYYPTDAEPPFAAVAISDGFGGSGGCGVTQTNRWGPFYASHGIVAMIVNTGSGDQPNQRGAALSDGIEGFKAENANSSSPLFEKLAGRYGTSGFSMGGGGTTYAAQDDATLKSSVGLMAWGPVRSGVTVPSLFICGASDMIAACRSHSVGAYGGIAETVDKMIITVSGGHVGQPSAGGGDSGATALAFQKLFLDGDERWRPILLMADYDETTIE